jgi:sugar phosphate isomerase/epimerase
MQLGVMNDPRLDACDEARWAADNGFDFLDLTLEGPCASLEQIDVSRLRAILDETGLGIIGHTAWYLPFASPFERVRQAAIESAADTFETFAALGVQWVNVHIVPGVKLFPREDAIRWNGECFAELAERASHHQLGIMTEHLAERDIKVQDIKHILKKDKRLGFHLDVGHAYVGGEKLNGFLKAFKSRLVHVHLSDNFQRFDDHLPLGVGRIEWSQALRLIRKVGYDGTMTLEVFSPDRDYVLLSAQKVRAWWDEIGQELAREQEEERESELSELEDEIESEIDNEMGNEEDGDIDRSGETVENGSEHIADGEEEEWEKL